MRPPDGHPPLVPTIGAGDAADRSWDVAVVGAGPAGALAARQLALGGARVLLLDRAAFPRAKVCGCCLNGAALAALAAAGLGQLPGKLGARPLHSFQWHVASRCAAVPLPAGLALSRWALDAALVRAAVASGSDFLPRAHAVLKRRDAAGCEIEAAVDRKQVTVRASTVLAADGLSGQFLRRFPQFPVRIAEDARLGAGVVLGEGPDRYAEGTIYMISSREGYLGLVRLEDGRLNAAAAMDREAVRRARGPGPLASQLLRGAGLPVPAGLAEAPWSGTPPLTRRRLRVAGHRVLVLGDAAGYVEPFTGEGMAWAMLSAMLVAPLVLRGVDRWTADVGGQWDSLHQRWIAHRQRICRAVRCLLRSSWTSAAAAALLAVAPPLAAAVVGPINRLPIKAPVRMD